MTDRIRGKNKIRFKKYQKEQNEKHQKQTVHFSWTSLILKLLLVTKDRHEEENKRHTYSFSHLLPFFPLTSKQTCRLCMTGIIVMRRYFNYGYERDSSDHLRNHLLKSSHLILLKRGVLPFLKRMIYKFCFMCLLPLSKKQQSMPSFHISFCRHFVKTRFVSVISYNEQMSSTSSNDVIALFVVAKNRNLVLNPLLPSQDETKIKSSSHEVNDSCDTFHPIILHIPHNF